MSQWGYDYTMPAALILKNYKFACFDIHQRPTVCFCDMEYNIGNYNANRILNWRKEYLILQLLLLSGFLKFNDMWCMVDTDNTNIIFNCR